MTLNYAANFRNRQSTVAVGFHNFFIEPEGQPDRFDLNWMKSQVKGLPSRIRSKLTHQFYAEAEQPRVRERNSNLRIKTAKTRAKIAPIYTQLKQFSFSYKAIATKAAVRKTAARIAADMYEKLLERAEAGAGLSGCYMWLCQYALNTRARSAAAILCGRI